jgi:hypothetical protein
MAARNAIDTAETYRRYGLRTLKRPAATLVHPQDRGILERFQIGADCIARPLDNDEIAQRPDFFCFNEIAAPASEAPMLTRRGDNRFVNNNRVHASNMDPWSDCH